MECPFCLYTIAELWQPTQVTTDHKGRKLSKTESEITVSLHISENQYKDRGVTVQLFWMQCPNVACSEILVLVRRFTHNMISAPVREENLEVHFAVPKRRSHRALDPIVPQELIRDYLEASLILEDSPRMSAVLSRRILADLLRTFGNRTEHNLNSQINEFIKDLEHPQKIKENLHYLREIADFGAHTQIDQSNGEIVNVGYEEAEFTLAVIDGLFDYFIVGPQKEKDGGKNLILR
jgi:hypothetical protein